MEDVAALLFQCAPHPRRSTCCSSGKAGSRCVGVDHHQPWNGLPNSDSRLDPQPYPQNLQTALDVENVIRSHGAVPATVAIMDGLVHVGLDAGQLERLASAPVRKTSSCSLLVERAQDIAP